MKNIDYDIELDPKNHIIAHIEGKRCLLDTGSPTTLGDGDRISFGAFSRKMVPSISEGWDIQNIRKLLGVDIDVLIGTDLLSMTRWYVDPFEKILTVGALPVSALPKGKVETTVGAYNGFSPILEGEVNGNRMEFLLDTGANVHFLGRREAADLPQVGVHEDFYPTIGKFESPLREAEFKMFNHTFGKMHFADLPEVLDSSMELGRMLGEQTPKAIAGMEILNHGSLGFDLRNGVVVFAPRGEM